MTTPWTHTELRAKAEKATARRAQLEFNFDEQETAVQLPTETAAATNPHEEGACDGEA
jgi:hypothetical protein